MRTWRNFKEFKLVVARTTNGIFIHKHFESAVERGLLLALNKEGLTHS